MNAPNTRLAELREPIGKHLATFNLFREADNSIHVTIAEAGGVRDELGDGGAPLHLCAMSALRAAVELRPSPDFIAEIERLREALGEALEFVELAGSASFYDEGGSDATAAIIRAALEQEQSDGE